MSAMYSKNGIIINKNGTTGVATIKSEDGTVKVDTTTLPNGVQYNLSVNTDIFYSGNCINVATTGNNVPFSFDVEAGITDIKLVNTLPEQPSSTVLYLIPEES